MKNARTQDDKKPHARRNGSAGPLTMIAILRDRGPAGALARFVLPLALLIPVAVGWARFEGQRFGLYGTGTGILLQVGANVLVTSLLLIATIAALFRSDRLRKLRELSLARSEEQYRLAEKVAHVGHWRMDFPSLAVSWSDEVFQICGIPKEAGPPLAADVLALYHPDDRAQVRQSVRDALRHGRGWDYSVRLCRPDGELRYVGSQGVCERDEAGNITSIFGVFADVTELEHARREAEAATATKSAFLANMSHEIRTPLNGVMGFAELLLTSDLEPEQKRHAALILDSAQTLLKLLNDILDVSKIDAGQMQVSSEPFDLPHQLQQCVRLMGPAAEKKSLELGLAIDPELPRHVLGDGLRLRQVVLNLLGNSLKFTERGRVGIEVVRAPRGDEFSIRVSDTGVGIPEERQESIFEEFVQADASISRRFGGSGLGLSISRRLVALMGGRMELWSREGEGTVVTVTLPLNAVSHPLRRRSDGAAESGGEAVPGRSAPSILLVEDLDINQELITAIFVRMGCRVEVAGDGAKAIEAARRLKDDPRLYDLIFMDVQMPVVDGLTATRAIRALGGRAAEIPIVALTANAYASEVQECRDAGMNDHLAKPINMAALGAALARWVPQGGQATPRRRLADAPPKSVSDKFRDRIRQFASRLDEIQADLGQATAERRVLLYREAGEMAHKVAGTAAMFGNPGLGDIAAKFEDELECSGTSEAADGLEHRLGDLIEAMREAA
jgi:PAS domain S-box-containing protein